MSWRLARSLQTLRAQIDAAHPSRSKASDGTIGDPAHAARKSDHNPDRYGVVRAFDLTHDPVNGVDCDVIAEAIKDDSRVAYLIWRRRIRNLAVSPDWRPYSGANPHDKHLHISVSDDPRLYDSSRPWRLRPAPVPAPSPFPSPSPAHQEDDDMIPTMRCDTHKHVWATPPNARPWHVPNREVLADLVKSHYAREPETVHHQTVELLGAKCGPDDDASPDGN